MVKALNPALPGRRKNPARKAFTLLEVLLAAAIGVLLMAALYVAMSVQLEHAQAGREAVEQSLLVRALFRRISNDITPSLASPPPAIPTSGAGMSAGGNMPSATSPTSPSSTSATAGTTTGSASSTTNSSNNTSSTSSTASTIPVLNLQGDTGRLILWVSRISSDLSPMSTNQTVTSDLHRVTYWLAGGDTAPLGLARQEVKQATSQDALVTVPPDIPDEPTYVIAEEVQGMTFRYFDGSAWQDSWDGTQTTGTSSSPLGPPQAVEITLTITIPNSNAQASVTAGTNANGNNANVKTYRHVVAIPTANGTTPPPTTTATTSQ